METKEFLAFGEVLKSYRKKRRLTQRQLAGKIGVHVNTVGAWERGDYLPETKGIVLELARQLNLADVDIRQLLESSLTALSSRWNVSYQRNPHFTGREQILQQIHVTLCSSSENDYVGTLALSGLGGVGKTQTAIEYAYRHAQDYTSLFWLNAATSEQMRSDLISIADLLNLSERQHQNQEEIITAVQHWLTGHRGWLLIIDNVQDIQVVKELLPAARSGSLLFTTRLPALGTLAQTLPVAPMGEEEGTHFLLRRANHLRLRHPSSDNIVSANEEAAAKQLVLQMDGLPLALDQAGAYIEKTQCGFIDFLGLFQNYPIQLLHERDAYEEHPTSVAKTFLLSFHRLFTSNSTAADLLTLCCLLTVESIPEELFTEANAHLGPLLSRLENDTLLYHRTLQELLSYSFLQRLPEIKSLSVHRLVRLVIREQLDRETQRQWVVRLVQAVNALFPQLKDDHPLDLEIGHWPRCQRLLPLVFACEQLIEEYHIALPEAVHLFTRAGFFLQVRARHSQAEILCNKGMQLSEELQRVDHIDTAILLSVMALISYELGHYEKARTQCQRVISISERVRGAEHPDTLSAINVLAEFYRIQGIHEEAEPLFLRVLAVYDQQGAPNERDLMTCLGNLGIIYHDRKQFEKAEPFYRRTLYIGERALGPEHFDVATALNNLARFFLSQEKYKEAEPLLQRALTIYEKVFGPEHPYIAISLGNLGQVFFHQQHYSEAEDLYQRALDLQERLYSSENVDLSATLFYLGQLFLAQERYSEAEGHLKRGLLIAELHLIPEHRRIINLLDRLAEVYRLQERYEEANPVFERLLDARIHVFGEEHELTRTTLIKYQEVQMHLNRL